MKKIMTHLKPLTWTVAAVLSLAIAANAHAADSDIIPEEIPQAYGIPSNRLILELIVDFNSEDLMRAHGWNIWAGLTANSTSSYNGKVLPIWETWLATSSVFTQPRTTPADTLTSLKKPSRDFDAPSQFTHTNQNAEPVPDLIGFNKFNPAMVNYLLEGHMANAQQANDTQYFYTSKNSLQALNTSWTDNPPTPNPYPSLPNRRVADAPNVQAVPSQGIKRVTSFELKPVLMKVKHDTPTALPFWQGPKASTAKRCASVDIEKLRKPKGKKKATQCHPDSSTWTHCVIVDPTTPDAIWQQATTSQFEAADMTLATNCLQKNAHYIGINAIYSFQEGNSKDHHVLMAMHVNTKELPQWTWQTYWWQAGQDTPDNYPGGADGKELAQLNSPWDKYNMCTAYSQTKKPDNKGEMRVCFNPYLETSSGIPDGLSSNCVSCHGSAGISANPNEPAYPKDYGAPVDLKTYFKKLKATATDFSWAIPSNAK